MFLIILYIVFGNFYFDATQRDINPFPCKIVPINKKYIVFCQKICYTIMCYVNYCIGSFYFV